MTTVKNAAGGAAVFGLVLLRLDVEFLNRFDVEVLQRAADRVVGVVAAVDEEVDVAAAAAVEGDRQLARLGRIAVDAKASFPERASRGWRTAGH